MSTTEQVVLITGGNTGLGLEIVKALLRSGASYNIIIGCRSLQKGEDAIKSLTEFPQAANVVTTVQVDLESDESIEKARDSVASKFGRLDVLINNGGVNLDRDVQSGKLGLREGWTKAWNVNVAGTMIMTDTFVPLLLKSPNPRLIFIASGTSSLADTERFDGPFKVLNASPEQGWPKPKSVNPTTIYKSSKTGLNMAMFEWHRILKNDGVKVWGVSPGFLATGLAGIGVEKLKSVSCLLQHIPWRTVTDASYSSVPRIHP